MRALVTVLTVAACCALAACTGEPTPAPSPTTTKAEPSPVPSGADAMNCDNPIDTVAAPPSGYTAVLGAVAVATRDTQQVNASGPLDPHHLFAKTGLLVHAGREATLSVGPEAAIFWGNHAAVWTRTLVVPACGQPEGAHGPWLAYPGGYSLDAPACLTLTVRSGTDTEQIRIPLGTPC